jgi:hypothetical protein
MGDPAMALVPGKNVDCNHIACLVGNLNSITCDYVVRQKLGGTDLRNHYFKQLPILPPSTYTSEDVDFIVSRVLQLTYTASCLQLFAQDLGYDGQPFRWDEDRRAQLRAELDAYYSALYGLTRDELRYVLDPADIYGLDFPGETFRVLKERETKQYGEYRTRRLVLEAWDRLGLEPPNRDEKYASEPVARRTASRAGPASPVDRTTSATIARDVDKLSAVGGSAPLLAPQVIRERTRTAADTLPLPPIDRRSGSDSQVTPAPGHATV